jgi:hypothetical protein
MSDSSEKAIELQFRVRYQSDGSCEQLSLMNQNSRNYIMETEEGDQYCRNQKFLKLLPNPNPVVTDIELPKVIPKNTSKPKVELGLPR